MLNSVVYSIIGVVVLLGGLIFFHELGHYLVAKLFGIKVEVFSLGFGKKIFRRRCGDTEYCISLFPLGGYVKLMGDDPYKSVPAEDAARAFSTQKLYKRFAVVAAGPTANLILAYFLYVLVFFFGLPVPSTKIGTVLVNSAAWQAGIRPKDRIVAVNGSSVNTWSALQDSLKAKVGEKLDLTIQRSSAELIVPYTVGKIRTKNIYGEDEQVAGIKGISPESLSSRIGISDPNTAGYLAGIRTGDFITKVGTQEVASYSDLNDALTSLWKDGEPLTISVKRGEKQVEESFSVSLPKQLVADKYSPLGIAPVIGLYPSELFVREISPGSAALAGGLKKGDRIVSVSGTPIYNFESIIDEVQKLGPKGEAVAFAIERDGKQITLNIKPSQQEMEEPQTFQRYKRYMIGFSSDAIYVSPELAYLTYKNPSKLLNRAAEETWTTIKYMVVSIGKLVTGKISAKSLGGPIMIASIAGERLNDGFASFIKAMAIISINLFLLNLFPIPVLDGGHLLFFSIEAIKGKPVSIKTMERANQIGMVFILALVAFTLFTDISRLIH